MARYARRSSNCQLQSLGDHAGHRPVSYPVRMSGAASRTRRKSVTAAGILLIILGALPGLGSLIPILISTIGALGGLGDAPDSLAFSLVFAIVMILIFLGGPMIGYSVLKIIAGVRVLRLRNEGRITGIVLCAIAMPVWLFWLFASLQVGDSEVATRPHVGMILFTLIGLTAETVTLVLLAPSGGPFRR